MLKLQIVWDFLFKQLPGRNINTHAVEIWEVFILF